jgi:hypothetical protein
MKEELKIGFTIVAGGLVLFATIFAVQAFT